MKAMNEYLVITREESKEEDLGGITIPDQPKAYNELLVGKVMLANEESIYKKNDRVAYSQREVEIFGDNDVIEEKAVRIKL